MEIDRDKLREAIASALAEVENPEGWTIPSYMYGRADSIIDEALWKDEDE